jgi:hypothetical protein
MKARIWPERQEPPGRLPPERRRRLRLPGVQPQGEKMLSAIREVSGKLRRYMAVRSFASVLTGLVVVLHGRGRHADLARRLRNCRRNPDGGGMTSRNRIEEGRHDGRAGGIRERASWQWGNLTVSMPY